MKSNFKRILSVVICALLLFSTLVVAPLASDADLAVALDRGNYLQGDTVTAQVYFPRSFDKVAALDLLLTYDSSKLSLDSLTMSEDFYDAYDAQINGKAFSVNYSKPGVVDWAVVGSNNFNFSGVFAEIQFTVKKNAAIGRSTISLTVEKAANSGYIDVTGDIAVENCVFIIKQDFYNDMTFILNASKTGYILKEYRSIDATDVTIPSTFNELPVVEIADAVFASHTKIESVSIPDTVTKIGANAFANCNRIKTLKLPTIVTEIGDNAFSGCSALQTIQMPLVVEKIGKKAFYQCYSLTSIQLPFTLQTIGANAFERCYGLQTVTISKNTAIGTKAFADCIKLAKFITVADNKALAKYISDNGLTVDMEYRKDISLGTVLAAEDARYTGETVTIPIKIELTAGETVSADTDYKLLFVDNKNIGKARCYVYGIGDYLEGYIVEFNICCVHEYDETVLKVATCTQEGAVSYKCHICGNEIQKSVDMLPHTATKWVYDVRPTVFATGIKHKVCTKCSTIFDTDTVAKKLYPDVDGDGKVNSIDALQILNYSVGKTGAIRGTEKLFNADTNADGRINAIDALNVLRISVGIIEL